MTQQEIRFFWPLTEQISLDLDFTPCETYETAKKMRESLTWSTTLSVSNGGTISTTNFEFRPNPASVGYWEVNPGVRCYVTAEPNWIVKKMSKLLLGWKWGKN